MRDYNYTELGMLLGAAVGGALSVLGFSVTKNALFFLLAAVGIFTGVIIGNKFDRNESCKRNNEDNENHRFS